MQTMSYAAEPHDVLMRLGIDSQLATRASAWVKPIVASAQVRVFPDRVDDSRAGPVKLSIPTMIQDLSQAIGMEVRDIILMPDDGQNAIIQAKISRGELSPKKRLGMLLGQIYDPQFRSLSRGVRLQVRESLNRVFRPQLANDATGIECAAAVAKTEVLYYFLCAAIIGDERRTARLAGLVRGLQAAVPLAMVDVERGIWLVHRV